MKILIYSALALFILFVVSSCDPELITNWTIVNESSGNIEITSMARFEQNSESFNSISPGTSLDLYEEFNVGSDKSELNRTQSAFETLIITNEEGLSYSMDLDDMDNWLGAIVGDGFVEFVLVVRDGDF